MSGRGGARGGRGGARGGRGGARGGRGGFASQARAPRIEPGAVAFPAFGVEDEGQRAQEQEERKREEDRRLRVAEEERARAIQEQQRRLQSAAEQERAKLSEQRRLYEEQIKMQREAVLKAEAERMRRLEEAQQELARRREAALRELAAEKEARARAERAKEDTERQTTTLKKQQQPLQQAPKNPVVQQQQQKQQQKRKEINSDSPSHANFVPCTYDDHQILSIYNSRRSPDPSLPAVPFTKKGNLFYLGLRKCEIIEKDGDFYVKLNLTNTEDLQTWLEKTERVEGLRTKGSNAARIYQNVAQMQVC